MAEKREFKNKWKCQTSLKREKLTCENNHFYSIRHLQNDGDHNLEELPELQPSGEYLKAEYACLFAAQENTGALNLE